MKHPWLFPPAVGLLTLACVASARAEISVPHQFEAGQTAVSAQVNDNFDALVVALSSALDRIDALEGDNAALMGRIEDLEADLAEVQGNNALALHDYVEVIPDPYILGGFTVRFTGVNLQIVNGMGASWAINGLGNLLVGYNENRALGSYLCSEGQYEEEIDCLAAGAVWSVSHKTGSHNIVGGHRNAYSSYGGLVVGSDNAVNRGTSSVVGGAENIASGIFSSILGGKRNITSGRESTVSAGNGNTAAGDLSSVSGGANNIASGTRSSVSGGGQNEAVGSSSSILGGRSGTASSNDETIPAIP